MKPKRGNKISFALPPSILGVAVRIARVSGKSVNELAKLYVLDHMKEDLSRAEKQAPDKKEAG